MSQGKGNWTRDESILAFSLYCRTPYGKINKTNPGIVELASIIGRTPSSVGMKMGNFGRFDPELQRRNVTGLPNGSKMDEVVWNEFYQNGESLAVEAARIMADYTGKPIAEQVDLSDLPLIPDGDEKERIVKARLNQRFFREALMSSYHSSCCITGISVPDLLVASYIKPWRASDPKTERNSLSNGLLLNALHGKAFERGYISISTTFDILASSKLSEYVSSNECNNWIAAFAGKRISLPEKFVPNRQFIEYHNDAVFLK